MKKISKLYLLFAMGIIFCSDSMIKAYEESSKKTECKKKDSTKKSPESGKSCMKKIEHEIAQILTDFKKDKIDADTANEKLNGTAQKIKKNVAQMKKEEKHGQMWKTHEHTLERKLKEARTFIKKNSK